MKQRWWLFPVVAIAALLLLLEVTAERRDGAATASAGKLKDENVSIGARLYVEYACIQCHGLGGRGRNDIQPSGPSLISLDFKQAFPVDAAVANEIKNGSIAKEDRTPSMPAWNGILSDEEIGKLVVYVRAGLPDLGVPTLAASTGEEIYHAFACVKCHGPLGTGGVRNAAASDPAHKVIPALGGSEFKRKFASRDEVRQVLLKGSLVEGAKSGVVYAPAWGRIGTAEQIEKVIDYLYGR